MGNLGLSVGCFLVPLSLILAVLWWLSIFLIHSPNPRKRKSMCQYHCVIIPPVTSEQNPYALGTLSLLNTDVSVSSQSNTDRKGSPAFAGKKVRNAPPMCPTWEVKALTISQSYLLGKLLNATLLDGSSSLRTSPITLQLRTTWPLFQLLAAVIPPLSYGCICIYTKLH